MIKYFDLKSGKKAFELNIHPDDRQFKGGSPWGGISVDLTNNLLFLTTGNPRPALLGSSRKGPNKNANSIIAIDLMKKKIAWSFQEVLHDLWDYDIASPPLLAAITTLLPISKWPEIPDWPPIMTLSPILVLPAIPD